VRRLTAAELLKTPPSGLAPRDPAVELAVASIIDVVGRSGDAGVRRLRAKLDVEADREWPDVEVPRARWAAALDALAPPLRAALEAMVARVRRFALLQKAQLRDFEAEVEPGVRAGQHFAPIEKVACYVPAGRHPLPSTAVMTVVPARVAGVREVLVLCPRPSPAVLAAAHLAGADRVLALGGAQGIAAAALGTASVPRVDLVCGPGGVYVAEAKRQLAGSVGTDLPAGPSEVLVVADETADPDLVFADLCAQAEHDPAARPLLVSVSGRLVDDVLARVERGFAGRPNAEALEPAFARNGLAVLAPSLEEAAACVDHVAPEHLEVMVADPDAFLARVRHFGAAFLGPHAAEVFGDYGAGPNHVLPTGGAARFAAGLSVLTFLRCRTTLRLEAGKAQALVALTVTLAEAEGLAAHAEAARLRGRPAG